MRKVSCKIDKVELESFKHVKDLNGKPRLSITFKCFNKKGEYVSRRVNVIATALFNKGVK